jgi:hypothetical protein
MIIIIFVISRSFKRFMALITVTCLPFLSSRALPHAFLDFERPMYLVDLKHTILLKHFKELLEKQWIALGPCIDKLGKALRYLRRFQ